MSGIKDNLSKALQKSKDAVTGTPAVKIKIREATSNKNWGPTGQQLQELARCSFHYSSFGIIMGKIWKRLNDHGKNWRRIYKALLVLDYLIKNGSKQVVVDARAHLPNIQTLTTYQHIDSSDTDVGQSVRERSRAIIELLNDPDRLAEEREKAKHNRGKYTDALGSDGRRATRSRDDPEGFIDDSFESKGDDFGGRSPSPSYSRRGGVNSPRPRRSVSESDDEVPKPEPLPVEWISDSQEDVSISYNNSGEAKSHRSATRPKPKKASRTPAAAPPDLQDKVKQLKEMFPGLSTEAAIKTLRKSDFSISDAALRLSDPRRMSKYTGREQQNKHQAVGTPDLMGSGQQVAYGSGAYHIGVTSAGQLPQSGLFQPQQTQPLQYPSFQPPLQQSSFISSQPGVGSPFMASPGQPQGFFAGTQQPSSQQPAASTAPQQGWTTFGTSSGVVSYGSSSGTLPMAGSVIPSVPMQQQQQQQPFVMSPTLQQQTQPLGSLPSQQPRQPPLSGGAPAIAPYSGTFPTTQGLMPQNFTMSSGSYGTVPAVSTNGGVPSTMQFSAAATPGSPLQPFHAAHTQSFSSPLGSPQLPQHSAYQQQNPALQQSWAHQQASGGFISSPYGQQIGGMQQNPGLYSTSAFLPSPPGSQSRPGQQTSQPQSQTNADATFAALVAQQLPKGAQLSSITGGAPQSPEPKKTLAQLQASPSSMHGGAQNPFGGPQQQQNLFF